MKKVLSIVLSIVLIALSLSCVAMAAVTKPGDADGNGEVAATDARMVLQVVAGLKDESFIKNKDNVDLIADGKLQATDARMILQMVAGLQEDPSVPSNPTEPPKFPNASDKAQWAELFNAETAKVAKGSYTWTRVCNYVEPLTADGVDVSLIQSTVDNFLGIGTANGDKSNAGKNALIAMNLTADDIKEIQQSNSQITLILNNPSNSTVGGDTPFRHVSNDIITKADVENEIKAALPSAKLNSFNANYYDVVVTAFLDNRGNPDRLLITYKLSAKIDAQAKVLLSNINARGEGTVETKIEYKDFGY